MFFDAGHVLGAFIGGYLCDITSCPALVNTTMLLAAALTIFSISSVSLNMALGLLFVTGEW